MRGTSVPVVTPFDGEGQVNHDALRELVRWMADAGVDGFVPCGSNGETPLLAREERIAVIETVTAATDRPVIAGTGFEDIQSTLDVVDAAADAGAMGALVVTPHYYDYDDEGMLAYYRTIADRSALPVYLYSVPVFTGYAIPPNVVATLAQHEHIHGIKDSSGDLSALQQVIDTTAEESFDVFVGDASTYASALDLGADGGILALANVVPGLASDIFQLHARGDVEDARSLNTRLVALNEAITTEYGIPGVKAALDLRGWAAGQPRAPLRAVDEEAESVLADLLTEYA